MTPRPPTRVLHVMNGTGGGAALSTLSLIRTLREQHGIVSSVVCNGDGPKTEHEAIRDAVEGRVLFTPLYWWNRKTRAKAWKRPLLELIQLLKTGVRLRSTGLVADFARRHGTELIHSNTILTLEGGAAARLLGLPHVWHLRELLGTLFTFPMSDARLGRYVSRRASVIIANSEACAEPWRPLLPAAQLRVIHNGIELNEFSSLERPDRATVVVSMVANLASRWKKHALFIDACRLVRSKTPVEFRLYGAVPQPGRDAYADSVSAMAKEAGVRLMGFAPAKQALADTDVLVHAADQESFGRTLVEAMAAGLPVVGVRGGGALEIVQHEETGLLADIDDAAALARAVERLLDDTQLRRRYGEAGRLRARARFSMESCAGAVAAVYEEAMTRPLHSRFRASLRFIESIKPT